MFNIIEGINWINVNHSDKSLIVFENVKSH